MVGKKAESLTWGRFVVYFLGRCVHVFTLSNQKKTRARRFHVPRQPALLIAAPVPCVMQHV